MTVLKPGPNKRRISYTRRGYLSQSRNTRRGSNYRRVPLTPTHHVELISYTPRINFVYQREMSKRRAYDVTLKLRQSSTRRRLAIVDAKRIREWCSQKEQLVKGSSSSNDSCPHRLVNVMASYNALHFIPLTSDCCHP